MTERGTIREIRGRSLTIVPEKSDSCFGCMNMECKADKEFLAENTLELPLEIGQRVEARAQSLPLLAQALAALLPPGLAFVSGYFITRFLFSGAGEGAFAFGGLILLFASAFTVYKLRKEKNTGITFRITKIFRP